MRRLALGASVLALALGATACGSDTTSTDPSSSASTGVRPVTGDEANRLGVARYNDYKRGRSPIEIVVPVGDQVLTLTGRIDFRNHRGLLAESTDDATPSYGVIAFNLLSYSIYPTASAVDPARLGRAPTKGWAKPQDITAQDPLAEVLRIALNLASDRPDNAQLLRQDGAEWHGSTVVAGTDVDLFTARPQGDQQTITYYVDATGNLVRADVLLPGVQRPATITLPAGKVGAVPVVQVLGKPPTATSGDLG